ncbi:hypothetical protein C8R44DRAFT_743026 [Mycena epipterygia]|nr:hypothetical protein C8R44DRAFT_743026 [Mycena epipterygia]
MEEGEKQEMGGFSRTVASFNRGGMGFMHLKRVGRWRQVNGCLHSLKFGTRQEFTGILREHYGNIKGTRDLDLDYRFLIVLAVTSAIAIQFDSSGNDFEVLNDVPGFCEGLGGAGLRVVDDMVEEEREVDNGLLHAGTASSSTRDGHHHQQILMKGDVKRPSTAFKAV